MMVSHASNSKEQNCQLKLEKTELFKKCQHAENRARDAQSENSELKKKLSEQKLQLAGLCDQLKTTQAGKNQLQGQVSQLAAKLKVVETEHDQLKQGMRRMNKYKVVSNRVTGDPRPGRRKGRAELLRDAPEKPFPAQASRNSAGKVLHQKGAFTALEVRVQQNPEAQ